LEGLNWPPLLRLQNEFQVIGFYLSAHPLDTYKDVLKSFGGASLQDMITQKKERMTFACVVLGLQKRVARSGHRYAFLRFSDTSSTGECLVFSELLTKANDLFEEGKCLLLTLTAKFEGESHRLTAVEAEDLDKALATLLRGVSLTLSPPTALHEVARYLEEKASGPIFVRIKSAAWGEYVFLLPKKYALSFQDLSTLRTLSGVQEVTTEMRSS
jgi:DNA polymerase-3 subunit alpha